MLSPYKLACLNRSVNLPGTSIRREKATSSRVHLVISMAISDYQVESNRRQEEKDKPFIVIIHSKAKSIRL